MLLSLVLSPTNVAHVNEPQWVYTNLARPAMPDLPEHFFQVKKATTTTRMVIAIITAGEVKIQWLEASGFLRVSIWDRIRRSEKI
jgi:hypothetical protein